jgi:hypothetical protein
MERLAVTLAISLLAASGDSAGAADGKLPWGPFKFGMSSRQVSDLAGGAKPIPEPYDGDQTTINVPNVKIEYYLGSMTTRFYKDRAYAFDFMVANAAEQLAVGRSPQPLGDEAKIQLFCPPVFERSLTALGSSLGRPDELLRSGELTQADRNSPKFSSARWWTGDGVRVLLTSNMRLTAPLQCTLYIGMHSTPHAKAYVPEIVVAPK